jgi:hypothetical protein
VSFPYVELFLGLLVAYMGYSLWAGLDSRYPIAAALVLLVVTAVVDAAGNTAAANTLAEYVFFLLGAGVLLLLIDHVRAGRPTPSSPKPLRPFSARQTAQPPKPWQGPTDDPLDRLEQQSVPVVHAAGRQDEDDEDERDQ